MMKAGRGETDPAVNLQAGFAALGSGFMSTDSFYTTSITVTCPRCGKPSRKLLREVVTNVITLCNHCPTAIDIGTPEWRAVIDAAAERANRRSVPAQ
jgi:hypothetical protein